MINLKGGAQTIISRSTWKEIAEKIKEKWEEDYFITDFDFGGGMYRVVLTKGTGWSGQHYRFGKEFPGEKVSELWDKGYQITNVTYDGSDWVVIMSGGTGITGQSWFSRSSFDDFEEKANELWSKGKDLTKVAFGDGTYLGVFSGNLNWGQHWWNWPEFPTDELMKKKQSESKIITDAFEFGNMVFAVASSNTGYTKQRIHKNKDWGVLLKLLKNRWDEDYSITTVSYYKEEWILVFSK